MREHESKAEAERKRRRKGGAVEGGAARRRLDRKASGGSIRSEFNAAINDQPARPTIREPGSVPAVHAFGGNDGPQMTPSPNNRGWVDGEPGKKRASGGRLTAASRNALPDKDFAGPGRSYPIENASHARNALSRVSQHGGAELQAKVRAKVHARFPGIGKR